MDSQGAIYTFDLLDWDVHHSVRVFSISAVKDVHWSELQDALQCRDEEDGSEWVLPIPLPSEAEALVQRAEASRSVIAVVATSDLLSVIDVWRPVAGPLVPPNSGGWLETLGLPRSGS